MQLTVGRPPALRLFVERQQLLIEVLGPPTRPVSFLKMEMKCDAPVAAEWPETDVAVVARADALVRVECGGERRGLCMERTSRLTRDSSKTLTDTLEILRHTNHRPIVSMRSDIVDRESNGKQGRDISDSQIGFGPLRALAHAVLPRHERLVLNLNERLGRFESDLRVILRVISPTMISCTKFGQAASAPVLSGSEALRHRPPRLADKQIRTFGVFRRHAQRSLVVTQTLTRNSKVLRYERHLLAVIAGAALFRRRCCGAMTCPTTYTTDQ